MWLSSTFSWCCGVCESLVRNFKVHHGRLVNIRELVEVIKHDDTLKVTTDDEMSTRLLLCSQHLALST